MNLNIKAMQLKNNLPKSNFKSTLFITIINKPFRMVGNPENLPQAHLSEKADSPQSFSGKISKLVGILLWIIVGLNIIVTFLIYKILF
jgi:hypothetical protein